MSNLTTVVNNIISKVNTHTTDLSNKATQISTHIPLSGITAYHLLQGNLAVSNYTTTQGFNTTLYTSGSATTGIDMDTQWGNTAEEKFGGLVWLKDRVEATNNFLYDTVRGATKEINSNTTEAEATLASGLTAFNSTGFTVGADTGHNSTTNNMVSWNFQTTHRITGTTNHGKAYTEHYNPYTGFTIIKYEGSGLAGHKIPHSLGRKLGFRTHKNLSAVSNFTTFYNDTTGLVLNLTDASNISPNESSSDDIIYMSGTGIGYNTATNQYIMYGWANSYFDESNKLMGNYEIGVYQGTGASGNKITTRGKPAWIMIKRIDVADHWIIRDNMRGSTFDYDLYPNLPNSENTSGSDIDAVVDGFLVKNAHSAYNASGGQYLYMVAYDTNANGGGSYYPLASDTSNLQIQNAIIPFANGVDSNGAKNTILSKNETFSGVTYTQGKNYPYYDALGNRGVTPHKPRYLESELVRTYAGESPDYFNVKENKWYSTNSGSEINTNSKIQTNDTASWTVSANGSLTWVQGRYSMARSVLNNNVTFTRTFTGLTVGVNYMFVLNTSRTGDYWYVSLDGGTTLYATITDGICYVKITPTTTSVAFTITQSNVNTVGVTLYVNSLSIYNQVITPTTEITNGRNYLNHIVYADNDGGVLYVEELPKIEYKDIVKANEFKGKNACTAWVNFDGTTTPPTIRDSYNVKSVVRTGTGNYDVYFETAMDNRNYVVSGTAVKSDTTDDGNQIIQAGGNNNNFESYKTTNKVAVKARVASNIAATESKELQIIIFGGKN